MERWNEDDGAYLSNVIREDGELAASLMAFMLAAGKLCRSAERVRRIRPQYVDIFYVLHQYCRELITIFNR